MHTREATTADIQQIQVVRHLVKENILSDPALVTNEDCQQYIIKKGKGWVADINGEIVGFAIADLQDHNIWALFVNPAFEKKGIGRQLHDIMLAWYFSQTSEPVWLSTSPNTRAAEFYRKAGWKEVGTYGKGEIKFEMTVEEWERGGSGKKEAS